MMSVTHPEHRVHRLSAKCSFVSRKIQPSEKADGQRHQKSDGQPQGRADRRALRCALNPGVLLQALRAGQYPPPELSRQRTLIPGTVTTMYHIFHPKSSLAAAWRAAFTAEMSVRPFQFSLFHLLCYFPTAGWIMAEGLTRRWVQTFLFQIAAFRQDLENRIQPYDCKGRKKTPHHPTIGHRAIICE